MLRTATPSFSKKNFSENQKWKKKNRQLGWLRTVGGERCMRPTASAV